MQNSQPSPTTGRDILAQAVSQAPERPGVYRFFDGEDRLLYVGKAKRLVRRLQSYLRDQALPDRIRRVVFRLRRVELLETGTEAEALLLEASLIKSGRPEANILLRDDRWFPHVALGPGPFPRLSVHLGKLEEGSRYIGPFADRGSAERLSKELQQIFKLRTCADTVFSSRSRPCMLYQIGRCSAPCVGRASPEAYKEQIKESLAFLEGGHAERRLELVQAMQEAAENLSFERAATLRDRLKALDRLLIDTPLVGSGLVEADVIALAHQGGRSALQVFLVRGGRAHGGRAYFPRHDAETTAEEVLGAFLGQFYAGRAAPSRVIVSHMPQDREVLETALTQAAHHPVRLRVGARGPAAALLAQVQRNAHAALERHLAERASVLEQLRQVGDLFALPQPPKRIELYDNSHLGGTGMLGAMIVVGTEGVDQKLSRVFRHVGDVIAGDDYGMTEAVLTRRFKSDYPDPDLIIVDGGPGQWTSARRALEKMEKSHIPLVAMAKGPDRHAGREVLYTGEEEIRLPKADPRLYALQRWRDAVHDKAVGAQRKLRGLDMRKSPLDGIEGLGPVKKRALIKKFGSAKEAVRASRSDLVGVPGITAELAERIQSHGPKTDS